MFRSKYLLMIALFTFALCALNDSAAVIAATEEPAPAKDAVPLNVPFYIGTYTEGKNQGKGIYLSSLNTQDGSLAAAELLVECTSPAFLVRHPAKPKIYVVGEIWGGSKDTGTLYSFTVDKDTNRLTRLPDQKIPGLGPTHLCVHCDALGDTLVVANYGSGNVVSLPINENGDLENFAGSIQHHGSGPNEERQKEPHPHGAYTVPLSNQILITDLGIDKLMMYKVDPGTAKITPDTQLFLDMPPGCGPRHLAFAFGPALETPYVAAKTLYVINELDSTVSVVVQKNVEKDATQNGAPPRWEITQTVSTLPKSVLDAPEQLKALNNTTAEVAVHPSGRFVYGSNRGHDSIAVFSVEKATGHLTQVQIESTRVKTPRHFAVSPCGRFLLVANQDSHSIITFRIDSESGKLTPTEKSIEVGSPICILF